MPCNYNMVINLINSRRGLLIAMERWKHAAFSKAPGCSQTSGECTSTETSPYVNNSLFISLLLSHFAKKKNYIGTWECGNIKNWKRSPRCNALGLLLGQICENTHRNKKGNCL
jgi:hypothetical protein